MVLLSLMERIEAEKDIQSFIVSKVADLAERVLYVEPSGSNSSTGNAQSGQDDSTSSGSKVKIIYVVELCEMMCNQWSVDRALKIKPNTLTSLALESKKAHASTSIDVDAQSVHLVTTEFITFLAKLAVHMLQDNELNLSSNEEAAVALVLYLNTVEPFDEQSTKVLSRRSEIKHALNVIGSRMGTRLSTWSSNMSASSRSTASPGLNASVNSVDSSAPAPPALIGVDKINSKAIANDSPKIDEKTQIVEDDYAASSSASLLHDENGEDEESAMLALLRARIEEADLHSSNGDQNTSQLIQRAAKTSPGAKSPGISPSHDEKPKAEQPNPSQDDSSSQRKSSSAQPRYLREKHAQPEPPTPPVEPVSSTEFKMLPKSREILEAAEQRRRQAGSTAATATANRVAENESGQGAKLPRTVTDAVGNKLYTEAVQQRTRLQRMRMEEEINQERLAESAIRTLNKESLLYYRRSVESSILDSYRLHNAYLREHEDIFTVDQRELEQVSVSLGQFRKVLLHMGMPDDSKFFSELSDALRDDRDQIPILVFTQFAVLSLCGDQDGTEQDQGGDSSFPRQLLKEFKKNYAARGGEAYLSSHMWKEKKKWSPATGKLPDKVAENISAMEARHRAAKENLEMLRRRMEAKKMRECTFKPKVLPAPASLQRSGNDSAGDAVNASSNSIKSNKSSSKGKKNYSVPTYSSLLHRSDAEENDNATESKKSTSVSRFDVLYQDYRRRPHAIVQSRRNGDSTFNSSFMSAGSMKSSTIARRDERGILIPEPFNLATERRTKPGSRDDLNRGGGASKGGMVSASDALNLSSISAASAEFDSPNLHFNDGDNLLMVAEIDLDQERTIQLPIYYGDDARALAEHIAIQYRLSRQKKLTLEQSLSVQIEEVMSTSAMHNQTSMSSTANVDGEHKTTPPGSNELV